MKLGFAGKVAQAFLDSKLTPLIVATSLGLGALVSASSTNAELYPVMLAGAVIVALPLIVLFLVFQRFIVKGIAAGAIKG